MSTVLRDLKLSLLRASRRLGVFHLARASAARSQRLLILCYHGVSIDDEHEWAPGLYMSQDLFASRMEQLRRGRYVVLPLGDAVRRLYDGTLPSRSVAITFDDGNVDFYRRAWPVLEAAGLPATVYLTTYYCDNNLPVFPLAVSYVLWKGRDRLVSMQLDSGATLAIDTRSAPARRYTQGEVLRHALDEGMSATEEDALTARLAASLGVDYESVRRRRMLHIMNPGEVGVLAAAGVDFQLHTHRHRSPLDAQGYAREVTENRRRIAAYAGQSPEHFCYPSGVCMPQFGDWLREQGVRSATTCEPGIASRASNPFQLPRLLDHSDMTGIEFDAWLSGIGALLPHRAVGFQPVDSDGRLIIPRSSAPVPAASAASAASPAMIQT